MITAHCFFSGILKKKSSQRNYLSFDMFSGRRRLMGRADGGLCVTITLYSDERIFMQIIFILTGVNSSFFKNCFIADR